MTPGVVAETDLAGTLASLNMCSLTASVWPAATAQHGTGGVFYYFSDHLKTASVHYRLCRRDQGRVGLLPLGRRALSSSTTTPNDYKFTGKSATLKPASTTSGARYYSNGLGRWVVSADWSATPVPVPYADFGDPQSLNLYGFAGGTRRAESDPDGHDDIEGKLISFFQ